MQATAKRRRTSRPEEPEGDEGNRLVQPGVFVWVRRVSVRSAADRTTRAELGGFWAKVLEPAKTRRAGSWWSVRELSSWGTYTVNAAWCRVPRTPSKAVQEYQQLLEKMRRLGVRALAGRS